MQLGDFQRYDAIAGTSKQAVMDHYEGVLLAGIQATSYAIQYLATVLLWPHDADHETLTIYAQRDDYDSSLLSWTVRQFIHSVLIQQSAE